tara:strand:- start:2995 stop:3255 length:261 start_codon:yes stop_codon:yes gene_type:complete
MADKTYYEYGKYMGWGSWKPKRKVSPAALNYPKTKILKMLKENYIPEVVEDTKTKMKKQPKKSIIDEWNDLGEKEYSSYGYYEYGK